MGIAQCHADLACNDRYQSPAGRSGADRRRHLPVDAGKTRLSQPLSLPSRVPPERVARWCGGRASHGMATWPLLLRLLLVADAGPVYRGGHESAVDRTPCRFRAAGIKPAAGAMGQPCHGSGPDRMGKLDGAWSMG